MLGIGAASKALERLGIEHEIVDAVEIDKYAITSFNAIHGTNFEVQDITKWDKDIKCDLIMHGSPCQDFSVAGKQAGGDVGSGTRSSLMYETIRIVGKLRPKYVVWENVKNLLSKKHKHNFDAYIETMNILGYNSYYQVLNAKDYGIPQNRERVFTISIRKDIDSTVFKFPKSISDGDINKVFDIPKEVLNDNERQRRVYSVDGISPAILNRTDSPKIINFTFPEKESLKLRLKDMLEEQVDEKYYLSDKAIQGLKKQEELKHKPNYIENKEIVNTIDTKVGDGTHFSPYLRENVEPKILEENLTYSPYVNKKYKEFYDEKGYIPEMFNPYNKTEIKDVAPTLTAQGDSITKSGTVLKCDTKTLEEPAIQVLGNYMPSNHDASRIVDSDGLAPTVKENHGTVTAILEDRMTLKTKNKRIKQLVENTNFNENDTLFMDIYNQKTIVEEAGTLKAGMDHQQGNIIYNHLRIRKLTPKECWRLMGFDDSDFEKAKNALNEKFYKGKDKSSSQLYKQAGNSIVVNVLEKIFKNLLGG